MVRAYSLEKWRWSWTSLFSIRVSHFLRKLLRGIQPASTTLNHHMARTPSSSTRGFFTPIFCISNWPPWQCQVSFAVPPYWFHDIFIAFFPNCLRSMCPTAPNVLAHERLRPPHRFPTPYWAHKPPQHSNHLIHFSVIYCHVPQRQIVQEIILHSSNSWVIIGILKDFDSAVSTWTFSSKLQVLLPIKPLAPLLEHIYSISRFDISYCPHRLSVLHNSVLKTPVLIINKNIFRHPTSPAISPL